MGEVLLPVSTIELRTDSVPPFRQHHSGRIYAMQMGSSNTASSFHNNSFSLVALPWNNYSSDPVNDKCTSNTDATSVVWCSSRVTPGAVLISVVSRLSIEDILRM